MKLAEVCVKRPVFATMLVLVFVVLGVFAYSKLGIDLYPKVDLPTVTVQTRLPGGSPEEIESRLPSRSKKQSTRSATSTNCAPQLWKVCLSSRFSLRWIRIPTLRRRKCAT